MLLELNLDKKSKMRKLFFIRKKVRKLGLFLLDYSLHLIFGDGR